MMDAEQEKAIKIAEEKKLAAAAKAAKDEVCVCAGGCACGWAGGRVCIRARVFVVPCVRYRHATTHKHVRAHTHTCHHTTTPPPTHPPTRTHTLLPQADAKAKAEKEEKAAKAKAEKEAKAAKAKAEKEAKAAKAKAEKEAKVA